VLVTTPQEVSLADVGKALAMFQRMSVPVLGLVENMTAFACPHCGELTEIFGRGGGERFAKAHDLEYLGGVPLDITVRQGGDVGVPAVAQRELGPAGVALTAIAQAVAARMSVRAANAAAQPVLTIS
jgi:ATP-binding protein involved in chromosome partitioning